MPCFDDSQAFEAFEVDRAGAPVRQHGSHFRKRVELILTLIMENRPGRFSVFLLLADRLYVSQQGEARWPCGAFFPISALPIETRPVFCVRDQLWHVKSFCWCFLHLTLLILKKTSHVSLCGAGRGRERECWDLIWRCELRGVLMMKCGREWWMCVRIKSASGSWADQTGRGLGLSLSLSSSLSLLANLFRERKRRTDAPSKMLYFPFIRPCHFCFELFSFFSKTHKLFSIDSGLKKYLDSRATCEVS